MTQETPTQPTETLMDPVTPETPSLEETLKQQLRESQDKYLRALAEQENARKRLAKEKQETVLFGIENALIEFLPAIDNLENALQFASSTTNEIASWAKGFQMILQQLKQVLKNYGISEFDSVGKPFDPSLHEAVEMVESVEAQEGIILKEFTKGYKSFTRTVRAARVQVARAPLKAEESSEKSSEIKE